MATFSKNILSGSTNGRPIAVTATGVSTTLIHQGPVTTSSFDEIWLYACNPTTSDVMLNILLGGTNFTSDIIFEGIIEAYSGNVLVIPGLIVKGDGSSGVQLLANVSVASGVNLIGYVNQIQ